MSLARNSQMPYVTAGRQEMPSQRISVRSNVYVPDADARDDYDGRPASYKAPAQIRREPVTVSMKLVVVAVFAAMFVLAMFYLSGVAKRASVYKEGQAIWNEIQSYERGIVETQEKIAQELNGNQLQVKAVELGMEKGDSVTPRKISAPDTRPFLADSSLTAGSARASVEP